MAMGIVPSDVFNTEIDKLEFPVTVQQHNLDKICSQILYGFIREFKPMNYLEVGTSWGGSARVAVKALLDNKKPFQYIGFEYQPDMKKSTEDNIIPLAPDSVKIYGEIKDNLDKIPQELDMVFWDTEWDYPITIWFLKNIFPRLRMGGLIQIHDWSVNREYVYGGGNFEGIGYLIKLFQQQALPLQKIFSVWDHDEYRVQSIAASFWVKTGEMQFCHECGLPLGKSDTNPMEMKQADGTNHLYCYSCSEKFKQILIAKPI